MLFVLYCLFFFFLLQVSLGSKDQCLTLDCKNKKKEKKFDYWEFLSMRTWELVCLLPSFFILWTKSCIQWSRNMTRTLCLDDLRAHSYNYLDTWVNNFSHVITPSACLVVSFTWLKEVESIVGLGDRNKTGWEYGGSERKKTLTVVVRWQKPLGSSKMRGLSWEA